MTLSEQENATILSEIPSFYKLASSLSWVIHNHVIGVKPEDMKPYPQHTAERVRFSELYNQQWVDQDPKSKRVTVKIPKPF